MGAGQVSPAGGQDRVGAGVLSPLRLVQQLILGRSMDRDRLDLDPAGAQSLNLAKNEGVRYGRVVADEVGDLHDFTQPIVKSAGVGCSRDGPCIVQEGAAFAALGLVWPGSSGSPAVLRSHDYMALPSLANSRS